MRVVFLTSTGPVGLQFYLFVFAQSLFEQACALSVPPVLKDFCKSNRVFTERCLLLENLDSIKIKDL